MISDHWVGGYIDGFRILLVKIAPTIGKNRIWVGRSKKAKKIGYHKWTVPCIEVKSCLRQEQLNFHMDS